MSLSDAIYITTEQSQVDVLKAFIQHLKHQTYTIEHIDFDNTKDMFVTRGIQNVILTAWYLAPHWQPEIAKKLGIPVTLEISIDIDKFTDISKVRGELVSAFLQYLSLHNETCAYVASDYDVICLYFGGKLELLKDYPLWEDFPEINMDHVFKNLPKI